MHGGLAFLVRVWCNTCMKRSDLFSALFGSICAGIPTSKEFDKHITSFKEDVKKAHELGLISDKYLEAIEGWKPTRIEAQSNREVILQGYVGSDTSDVIKGLKDIRARGMEPILVINSGGGNPFHGYRIANAVVETKASVVVDALAASAASFPVFASESVTMRKGSQLMVHRPQMFAGGNLKELQARIKSLENLETDMIALYSGENSALSESEAKNAMYAETWYSAADAKKVLKNLNTDLDAQNEAGPNASEGSEQEQHIALAEADLTALGLTLER